MSLSIRPPGRRWLLGAGLALALLRPTAAGADTIQLPIRNFQPAASTLSYLVSESGRVLPHLTPSVRLLGSYAHRPVDLFQLEDGERLGSLVDYRVNLDLLLALGLFDFLELGVALPATVAQQAGGTQTLSSAPTSLGAGLGDLRFIPKAAIRSKFGATLAVAVPFTVPTGSREQLLGDDFLTLSPRLIFSVEGGGLGVALNAGVLVRRQQDVPVTASQRLRVDDEVFGSLGLRFPLAQKRLELLIDGFFSLSLYEQNLEQMPVEVLGGLRAFLPLGFVVDLAAGGGATRGVGAPRFRVVGGIGYQYDRRAESRPKAAPPAPDSPSPTASPNDADGDGIPDATDQCPNEPEDPDKYQDEDGCPEPDNDADGVLDADDRCPNEKEDADGFEDQDGCPDLDNDRDGIPDTQDRCPQYPEDQDQYMDGDGCPDPDNDSDGIPDKQDRCPTQPEDRDGFEDTDGCPDLDNDHDGVPDLADRCPTQPEVKNGVDDTDGCPDSSRGPVQITRNRITVPPVYFATNRDVILARSFPVLRLVALSLKDNAWIKRVRIEGHTDSRGRAEANLDLSRRRAASVLRFLVQQGIDSTRLVSEGYGETRPIATNKTRRGRAQNRRVDFFIIDPAGGNGATGAGDASSNSGTP